MKWMGGWNYDDLCSCPSDMRDDIVKIMKEEAAVLEKLGR